MNLVGGIYTVIRSKAPAAVDVLGNKYCLIGIYNDLQCKTEVEMVEPEDPAIKGAIQAMRDSGVEVWDIYYLYQKKKLSDWLLTESLIVLDLTNLGLLF